MSVTGFYVPDNATGAVPDLEGCGAGSCMGPQRFRGLLLLQMFGNNNLAFPLKKGTG